MNPLERPGDGPMHASRQTMSALADAQPDAADAALALWAGDAEARRAWHAYQLIGDVLRSDELAVDAGRDEALLAAVRARLADEPAIVAPLPVPAAPAVQDGGRAATLRRRWSFAAAAAGFLAVGGVVGVLQGQGDTSRVAAQAPGSSGLAVLAPRGLTASVEPVAAGGARVVPAPGQASAVGVPGAIGADPQWRLLDGKVIRDARLDAYLRAHRGTGAVAGRFETVVLER